MTTIEGVPRFVLGSERGTPFVEGSPGAVFLGVPADAGLIVEACLAAGVEWILLPATSLDPRFFDVSSGIAADLLQKLRNYALRVAVVADLDTLHVSSRFGELLNAERRDDTLQVFGSREAALRWLIGG